MNQTILRICIITLTCLVVLSCQRKEDKVPGSFHALDMLNLVKAFPASDIPDQAHYKAWKKLKAEHTTGRRGGQEFKELGPWNVGGRTLEVKFNPQRSNTIYAGTASGGLWRSYQSGLNRSWHRVKTGFPVMAVSAIEINPADTNEMYIGTGEVYNLFDAGKGAAYRSLRGTYGIGILKTTDGGLSWEKSLDWSFNQRHGVNAVKFAGSSNQTLYAATTDGVYKSSNAGRSWEKSLDVKMVMDLVTHPNNKDWAVASCGNFNSPGKGIYYTRDGGQNWIKVNSNLPLTFQGKIQLASAPSEPMRVYASIGNGFGGSDGASWLCRSVDFGESWSVVNTLDYSKWQGWFSHDVAVSPTNKDEIIVVGIHAYKSFDGGESMVQISDETQLALGRAPIDGPDGPPGYMHVDHHSVEFNPTNPMQVLFGNDGGVYTSQNGGFQFRSINAAYQTTQFYNGFSVSQDLPGFALGGLQDNSTAVFVGDEAWVKVIGGDGGWSAIPRGTDSSFFASYQFLNVLYVDQFKSVQMLDIPKLSNNLPFIAPYIIASEDDQRMYAAGSGVHRSDDGGRNWYTTNQGRPLQGNSIILSLDACKSNPDVIYAGTAPVTGPQAKLFRSRNGGNVWLEHISGLPNRIITDIFADPENENRAFLTTGGFGSGHVFMSDDYGANWVDISYNLPDVPHYAVCFDQLEDIIYVGNEIGLFWKQLRQDAWEFIENPKHDALWIMDLKIKGPEELYIATHGNGAFMTYLIKNVSSIGDHDFDEFVNLWPNPAQDKIYLELPSHAKTDLSILDLNGKILWQGNPEWEISGDIVKTEIDLSGLVNGTYLIRGTNIKSRSFVKLD